jgi:hypothetical protein
MAVLDTKDRRNLPKEAFGLPGARKFPMPNRGHAMIAAKDAKMDKDAGHITKAQENKVDKKAEAILAKGDKKK